MNWKRANNFHPVADKFTKCTDGKQPLNLPVMRMRLWITIHYHDGGFDDGRSPTAENHWKNLTEVTAVNEDFAIAGGLIPSDVAQTAAHRLEQVWMGHWELVPNVQGSSTEKFCSLASSGDVTIGSVLAVCDGNLVVQSRQTGGGRTQHNLSLCSHRGYDRFHQESFAPARSSRPSTYTRRGRCCLTASTTL